MRWRLPLLFSIEDGNGTLPGNGTWDRKMDWLMPIRELSKSFLGG